MGSPQSADKSVPLEPDPRKPTVAASDTPHLERLVDAFEEAWQSGTPPSLAQFLSPAVVDTPSEGCPRRELLEELIKIDLEYRWRRVKERRDETRLPPADRQNATNTPASADNLPETPRLEDYVACYPELGSLHELPVDLIGEEYRVRRLWGDAPGHAEYLVRFPEQEASLRALLARTDAELITEAGEFSSKNASPRTIPSTASGSRSPSGDRPLLVDYEIMRELGRGGMGIVYQARQRSLDRLVALKVIQAGAYASPEELARFRTEAEAVARLHDAHIVQIYEVGERDGKPYFSLEYLEGGSLAQQLAGTPQPARVAARMVEILARAIHSAHQHGIVHRDLKPANILLACSDPIHGVPFRSGSDNVVYYEPKISDFGLAKRLDKEVGQTLSGAIMGTPSYMAAEQAAGKSREIGPAADIYGLGAILYEMLTGRPPFKGETTLDTLQQVLSVEPVPPMQLHPKVPRDLQTICLKCLQKAPGSRYASALALAEDLQRFLAGEPILARPVSAWERAAKWARRRPATAALVVVSSLAALGLVLGVFWHNARLRDALQLAEQRREEAQQERAHAAANFQRARDAVDELTDVGEKRLAHVPQMEEVRRALLEKALRFYQGFLEEQSTNPAVRRETARAYQRTAAIYEMLGQHGQAEEALRQALRLQERLAEQFPSEPRYTQDRAATLNSLGNLYRMIGPPAQAEESYKNALDLHEQLVLEHPAVATYQQALAKSHLNLGVFHAMAGRTGQAETYFQKALAFCEQLNRDYPDNADYENDLARSYTNLGNLYGMTNRADQAEAAYRKGLTALEHLARAHPDVPSFQSALAAGCNNLGHLLNAAQRPVEAKAAYQKTLEIRERLTRDYPKVFSYALELGGTYTNMADLVRDAGAPQGALPWYARALQTLEAQLQQQPRHTEARQWLRNTFWGRAEALSRLGRHAQALGDWDRALAADDGSRRDDLELSRAACLARLGEHVRATAETKRLADSPPSSGEILYTLACVYSLSAAAARQDGTLSPAESKALAESYARRAIDLLAKTETAGYFKNRAAVEHLKTDPDLVAISTRDDFKKWLAALEAKTKPGGNQATISR